MRLKKLLKEDHIDSSEKISVQQLLVDSFIEEHIHEFVEVEYILSGQGLQTINGCTRKVGRGSLILINYQDRHSIETSGDMDYVNILLEPEFVSHELTGVNHDFDMLAIAAFSDFDRDACPIYPVVEFKGREMLELESLIRTMLDEFKQKRAGYITVLKSYVNILFTAYLRKTMEMLGTDAYRDVRQTVRNVLDYIEAFPSSRLSLKDLAGAGFYNPSYFSRMFREQCGMTVREYLCRLRIQSARKMLEETSLKLYRIAIQAGFGNSSSFYRIFREHVGMTPEEYRKACHGSKGDKK
ncbi:MAG TPA: hypothetical protein DD727_05210 [Clostridiales bacterium]|nr:hypothetical protein [Clostridiales bacterium]